MRDALPQHFAVVGPAWLDFERAVRAAGVVGEDLSEQIESLRGLLSPATLDTAHQLRRQRNALFHDGTLIRDLRGWEAQCRRTIAELRVPSGVRPSIRVAAGRRAQSSRPLARVAGVLAVAALCGLGVVAFAWFDMADICRAWADRLGCTFDTAIYVKPALAVLAVATAAFLPALLRGLRR